MTSGPTHIYTTHHPLQINHHHHRLLPQSPPPTLLNFQTSSPLFLQELANHLDDGESSKGLVLALYSALSSGDAAAVQSLLAPDLEWWFHGPPAHQFLMRLLTGAPSSDDDHFTFSPLSVAAVGPLVLAEGCDHRRQIAWVHAWTVTNGVITHVREYFNTAVTVTRLGNTPAAGDRPSEITPRRCPPLWESRCSNRVGKSVPGLVLAL